MMRIAVVGARGQLGAAIVGEFMASHEVTPLGRADLDITDGTAVEAVMTRLRPEIIVNCAYNGDVDGAEDHPVEAFQANAFGVRALARAASASGATLIHYSSDFVFDGTAGRPYTEDDRPNPRSVYAVSKMLGEWFANDAPRAYVLRVESLFGRAPNGPPAKGSVAGILKTMLEGGEPTVFEDRTVSPTYLLDAARATRQLVEAGAPPALYHCVNSGHCTWLEFALELARQLGIEPRLKPVRMADIPLRARRPQYCALSNEKLASIGIAMPAWQDALQRYLKVSNLKAET
jgi:dTDP-4-dehydrorhamnose reductase